MSDIDFYKRALEALDSGGMMDEFPSVGSMDTGLRRLRQNLKIWKENLLVTQENIRILRESIAILKASKVEWQDCLKHPDRQGEHWRDYKKMMRQYIKENKDDLTDAELELESELSDLASPPEKIARAERCINILQHIPMQMRVERLKELNRDKKFSYFY